ncbi:MAG: phosphoenolpyruvate--protein phosphotransferase [Roseinatronobacter sp.]
MTTVDPAGAFERAVIVRVREGLHARPATRLVKLARGFESAIEIRRGVLTASAKSSVKLMLLGVKENEEVTLRAEGADARAALDALAAYLEDPRSGLEEAEAEAGPVSATDIAAGRGGGDASGVGSGVGSGAPMPDLPPARLHGVGASEGVAMGPVFAYFPAEIVVRHVTLPRAELSAEIARLSAAITQVSTRMQDELRNPALQEGERAIIAALSEIAGDADLRAEAEARLQSGLDAVAAISGAVDRLAAEFAALDDPYMRVRADDLRAVGRQIALALLGLSDPSLADLPEGAVLVADDLSAWDLARAPLARLAGLVCGQGGATSHVAIIARARGIPAVLGLGAGVSVLARAERLALDGAGGGLYPDPDPGLAQVITRCIADARAAQSVYARFRDAIPLRPDGRPITVAANLGDLEEIAAAHDAGAMGVGLFRTEFLFMKQRQLPDEEAQLSAYTALLRAFPGHDVVVRTLDVGGDKPVPGMNFPAEANPFLGWRGIRMCLDRPDLFKVQVRALLRAAPAGRLKVMLPMVTQIDEVTRTRALIAECEAELGAEGLEFAPVPLGVMIETPAAVLIAAALAREVAFFSIGTNDLTQYVMAADRLNRDVAHLNRVEDPAVMGAIEMTVRAAQAAGIPCGMCGEAAGRPDLIGRFAQMGLDSLSMSAAGILRAKKLLSDWAQAQAQ